MASSETCRLDTLLRMLDAGPLFRTIPEIVDAGRAKLSPEMWGNSFGGAESETTIRRNRTAFESLAFRPRMLTGVKDRELATSCLGHRISMPVMLAPVGGIARFDPGGGLAWARAAKQAGTIAFISHGSLPRPEDIQALDHGPVVAQLYVDGDVEWQKEYVRDATRAGYVGICLTADAPTLPRSDRDLMNNFSIREMKANDRGVILPAKPDSYRAAFRWEDFSRLRDSTQLKLILKGVMSGEDAAEAVRRGTDAVYVSNHGGRATDHLPSTIEVLPEIVQAVAGKAEVVVDSGYIRGSDVVKAIALGANAVCIGRLAAWAIAAGGEPGLGYALELLRLEIGNVMAGIGARSVGELGPHCLRQTIVPAETPWPTFD
jgi:isopentenyl diphosphate isomerase/L-lactate dehydrogenase-like FMN-dependent dehydrogenase